MAERMLTAYDVTPTANERIQAQMNAMKMMEMQRQIAEQQDTRAAFNQFYNQGIEQQTPVPQSMEQQAGRLVDEEMGNPVAPVPMQTTRRRPNLQEVGEFYLGRGDIGNAANMYKMQEMQQKTQLEKINGFANALFQFNDLDPSGELLRKNWDSLSQPFGEFTKNSKPEDFKFSSGKTSVLYTHPETGEQLIGVRGPDGKLKVEKFGGIKEQLASEAKLAINIFGKEAWDKASPQQKAEMIKNIKGDIKVGVNYLPDDQVKVIADQVIGGKMSLADMSRGIGKNQVLAYIGKNYPNVDLVKLGADTKYAASAGAMNSLALMEGVKPLMDQVQDAWKGVVETPNWKQLGLDRQPLANQAKYVYERYVGGSPEATRFAQAKNDLIKEVERVLTGQGAMSDSRIKMDVQALNEAMTPAQLQASMDQLKKTIDAREGAIRKGPYGELEKARKGGQQTLPPAAIAKLSEGKETVFANGQIWTKKNGAPVRIR